MPGCTIQKSHHQKKRRIVNYSNSPFRLSIDTIHYAGIGSSSRATVEYLYKSRVTFLVAPSVAR